MKSSSSKPLDIRGLMNKKSIGFNKPQREAHEARDSCARSDAGSYLQQAFHAEIILGRIYYPWRMRCINNVSSFLIANRWNPGKVRRFFLRSLILRDFRMQSHRAAKDGPPSASFPPSRTHVWRATGSGTPVKYAFISACAARRALSRVGNERETQGKSGKEAIRFRPWIGRVRSCWRFSEEY